MGALPPSLWKPPWATLSPPATPDLLTDCESLSAAGCLGAAALLEGVVDLRGARVGVILSGGNVDLPRYAEFLAQAPG